mgnify:FL=1
MSWDTNWNPDLDPLHRRRNPDDVSGGGVITHLTMWAENDEGLVNLMKASTDANLEGRVMRYPRMDKEILAKYSKGIIASSGCRRASSRLVCAWASSMTRCVPPANSKTFSAAIISTSNSWTTA